LVDLYTERHLNRINFNKALLNDDELHYGLGYSENGIYNTTLLAGAVYNSYKLRLYAQIFDDDGAFTIYHFNKTITVEPNFINYTVSLENLNSGNAFLSPNDILSQGSYLSSVQETQNIASLLNQQSLSDKLGLIFNDSYTLFPLTYGPLANFDGVNAVYFLNKNFSHLKLMLRNTEVFLIMSLIILFEFYHLLSGIKVILEQ